MHTAQTELEAHPSIPDFGEKEVARSRNVPCAVRLYFKANHTGVVHRPFCHGSTEQLLWAGRLREGEDDERYSCCVTSQTADCAARLVGVVQTCLVVIGLLG
jgi:hypothetical protein